MTVNSVQQTYAELIQQTFDFPKGNFQLNGDRLNFQGVVHSPKHILNDKNGKGGLSRKIFGEAQAASEMTRVLGFH